MHPIIKYNFNHMQLKFSKNGLSSPKTSHGNIKVSDCIIQQSREERDNPDYGTLNRKLPKHLGLCFGNAYFPEPYLTTIIRYQHLRVGEC